MQDDAPLKDRQVVPRWRELARTPGHELQPALSTGPAIQLDDKLIDESVRIWHLNSNVETAAEVLDSGTLSSDRNRGRDAASFLLQAKSSATPALRVFARRTLGGELASESAPLSVFANPATRQSAIQQRIARLRTRCLDHPGDALAWLEISRLQTTIAQLRPAEVAMRRAIGAARNNRVVLRAAARFYVHSSDPERAHAILARSDAIQIDPWVQAAEIALARLAGKSPRSMKRARERIDTVNEHLIQFSDLASAVATEELFNGDMKRSRRHFQFSLRSPTENAFAQALWAKSRIRLDVLGDVNKLPYAYEASVRLAVDAGDFDAAFRHCFEWLNDEPYSSRPAINGSFFAAEYNNDCRKALQIAERGLIANPSDILLNNNAVVALCRLGRIEEASRRFATHLCTVQDPMLRPVVLATAGLIEFSRGDLFLGRNRYGEAIRLARSKGLTDVALRALIYWVEREVAEGTVPASVSENLFSAIGQEIRKHRSGIRKITGPIWQSKLESMRGIIRGRPEHSLLSPNVDSTGVVSMFMDNFYNT
jgi:tetratricopeptide (TPR) repeat protein